LKKIILSNKTNLFTYLFLFYSLYFSINQGSYIYDGYHWGLVASNANDLINGKLPYKDFFVHYGFLTTLIHAIAYSIYDSILSLIILTSFFYIFSIFLLIRLVKKYSNENYALMTIFIFFFMQPFVVYPWHTYLIFLFSLLSISFYINHSNFSYFLFGFFIQLCFLSSESFKICSYIIIFISIFLLFFQKKEKNVIIKNSFCILFGYFLPISLFIFFLHKYNLYESWILHSRIPEIFLKNMDITLFELVVNFGSNYINSLANLFDRPYIFLGILINIVCLIFIFKNFLSKKINTDLIFISLFSILLNYMLVFRHESFRFFSGPIIGIIILTYFLTKLKKELKYFIIFLILVFSSLSNPYEKGESNYNFVNKNIKKESLSNKDIRHFKFLNFKPDTWEHYSELQNIYEIVKKNCPNLEYFYNSTSDHFYYLVLSDHFHSLQSIPGNSESNLKDYYDSLNIIFDPNLEERLNSEIIKGNVIIIKSNSLNTLHLSNSKIALETFDNFNLKYSYNNKHKTFYYPKKCAN